MTHTLPPPAERYFEHYPVGATLELGSFSLSEPEILAFARRYDPQLMHTDPAWAETGPFGGLIASGWHTIAALMPLVVNNYLPAGGLVSPGIDEVRWLLPVRPEEILSVRATITAARRSRSRPDRGLVTTFIEVLNPAGEPALTMRPMNFIRCRPESLARSP
jgi:acyl dehydratase